jgi:hypothetical protein
MVTVSQFREVPGFGGLFINGQSTFLEVKKLVVDELIKVGRLPEGTSPKRIRIRDKVGSNPGKLLCGPRTFVENQIYLYDNKVLCFEILPKEEDLPELDHGGVVLLVQRWYRSSWTLGDRFEVLLPGSTSVRNISRGLGQLTGIPLDSMRAMVLPRDSEYLVSELHQPSPAHSYGRQWFDPTKETRMLRIMSHDLRVGDGDVLLLQDCAEPLRPLSPEDRKSIEIVQAAHKALGANGAAADDFWSASLADSSSSSSSSGWTGSRYPAAIPGAGVGVGSSGGTSVLSLSSPYAAKRGAGGAGGGGVVIKTHRDRMLQQAAGGTGTGTGTGSGTNSTTTMSLAGSHTDLQQMEYENAVGGEDREFHKAGGMALFDDIN